MMAETLRVHSMMGEDLLFLTDEKLREFDAAGRVVAVDPEELGSAVLDEYLSSKGGE